MPTIKYIVTALPMYVQQGTSESMPKIDPRIVSDTWIPLPPIAEQKCIVTKFVFCCTSVYKDRAALTGGSVPPAAVPQRRPSHPLSLPGHTLPGPCPGAARTPSPITESPAWSWYPFSSGQSIFYRPADGRPKFYC